MKKALLLIISLSLVSLLLVFGILQNYLTYKYLMTGNLDKASNSSKRAIFLPQTINLLTLQKIELVKFWTLSIKEMPTIKELTEDTQNYLAQTLNSENSDHELSVKIINNLEKINDELNKIDSPRLNEFKLATSDVLTIAQKFLATDQNYIVVLQNSDELRATGGFVGSFVNLQTQDGQILPLQIQDIYVPDGQFTGFIEAPAGLDEYLSSGKGLRLPDANWWPNFADSAEQIIYFFESVSKQKYQGVIAINLNTVEQLLDLTGEVYLPDYNAYVNKDNFAQIARADRSEFFPGSQEKANFLNHFFNVFKLQLSQSIKNNPMAIIKLGKEMLLHKDLQLYSKDTEIQEILRRRKLAGSMENQAKLYYFLVESNVGINKANRLVTRSVKLDIQANQEKITIKLQNGNQIPYVNYQRLYTNPATKLISTLIDGQKISEINQNTFTTKEGQQFTEIGFLISVLTNSQSEIEITLQSPLSLEDKKQVFIQKQAGLPDTNYTANYQEQNKNFKLDSDQKLIFD